MITETSLIKKAEEFAKEIHAGQTRKTSKKPYIVHPLSVLSISKQFGLSKEEQIVALLHDTYEDYDDKNYVKKVIEDLFGSKILSIVLYLSHDKSDNYKDYILKLAKISPMALNVKLCDMISNLSDSPSPKQFDKYLSGIQHLIRNDIYIDKRIMNVLKKLFKNKI